MNGMITKYEIKVKAQPTGTMTVHILISKRNAEREKIQRDENSKSSRNFLRQVLLSRVENEREQEVAAKTRENAEGEAREVRSKLGNPLLTLDGELEFSTPDGSAIMLMHRGPAFALASMVGIMVLVVPKE